MFKIMPRPLPSELPGIKGPGVERVAIAEVDQLVAKYVDARDARLAMLKLEIDAKTELIDALHKNVDKIGKDKEGTITYRHDDLVVILKHGKDDLKVKTIGGADDDEGE